ncbi:MAG: DUF4249 domain-containing protein [Muribaculaceae bacterium]|nr:DUF4249 domain-containing protein [Muribaculaceae bacterium]
MPDPITYSRHILRILISAVLSLVLSSCEKTLHLPYDHIPPLTVIEASLTDTGASVAIRLSTPMDEPLDLTLLTDAQVTLSDLTLSSSPICLSPDSEGYFTSAIPGEVGHLYQLDVIRDGATYSSQAVMQPPVTIEGLEFSWINMPYDQVALLQVAFADVDPLSPGNCYWVRLYRNGEAYMWNTVKDDTAIDGTVYEVFFTTRRDTDEEDDDTVLFDGDVITATVVSISRDMYDYLQALAADSSGPAMFTGPRALGYFLPATPSSSAITFHP